MRFFYSLALISLYIGVAVSCNNSEPNDLGVIYPTHDTIYKIPKPDTSNGYFYPVKWVADGDTFWVDDGSDRGLKIRLIGINAPETSYYGGNVPEEYGQEASDYLKKMLKNKSVWLNFDVQRYDKYGRTLAYAFLEDKSFINYETVRNGYARSYTFPPNVKHQGLFKVAEDSARAENKGLWGL